MVPCSQLINKARSSYSGNRQTRMTTVTLTHALQGLIKFFAMLMNKHCINISVWKARTDLYIYKASMYIRIL